MRVECQYVLHFLAFLGFRTLEKNGSFIIGSLCFPSVCLLIKVIFFLTTKGILFKFTPNVEVNSFKGQ